MYSTLTQPADNRGKCFFIMLFVSPPMYCQMIYSSLSRCNIHPIAVVDLAVVLPAAKRLAIIWQSFILAKKNSIYKCQTAHALSSKS